MERNIQKVLEAGSIHIEVPTGHDFSIPQVTSIMQAWLRDPDPRTLDVTPVFDARLPTFKLPD